MSIPCPAISEQTGQPCGMTIWRRNESGIYGETHYVKTDDPDEVHSFDDRHDEVMEVDGWECMGAHHAAPPDIAEQLEEMCS